MTYGDGWLLVDTGLDDEATRAAWRQVFAQSLGGRPVARVLVTHFHPDHVGLAGWIGIEWDAPLLMPRSEWQRARLLLDDSASLTAGFLDLQWIAGAPAEHLRRLEAEGSRYRRVVVPLPPTFRPIAEGGRDPHRGPDLAGADRPRPRPRDGVPARSGERRPDLGRPH
ncbi:MBL fold metallo-hydrolase [Roseomonas mucosa]|uniref:MBL fold metallo-hydrolase n=1 Tax=Roseomonas mucosa TaxID=207340 RepID=UPI00248FD7F7|nr:MBL fold metallo-hydrolase [Roseomonas mucosa]